MPLRCSPTSSASTTNATATTSANPRRSRSTGTRRSSSPRRSAGSSCCTRGDQLVAGGAFKPFDEQTVELKRIWTAPSERGRGLAAEVVRELESEARGRGYSRVYLTTGPRQPEAVRLYRRLGYTPLYDLTLPAEEVGIHPFEKALTPAAPAAPAAPTGTGASAVAAARDRPVVPLRHPLRWVTAALVLVVLLNLAQTLFTNPSWEWPRVGKWLFSPAILTGLQLTLVATALSAVISFAGGSPAGDRPAVPQPRPVEPGVGGTSGSSGRCR
ncbi:GNAT family N-acetyltransferase [Curtobacterium sp. MCPF17_052]|uniref:GNAT family N-acetyltransferase n=1 Tax=Curtobacterium sp. MCPF17_052 TaxID=2175655 RepID=UPI0024DFDC38|nr:GNAT family N-acetyltransferase [Curtobacterium sp. MCPF17_052]WIB14017.1 GNAT family N-acetyltransferase [Curtobacterium sp. MCPF17_052]